jgi:phosphoserine phosphatase RsbU/P
MGLKNEAQTAFRDTKHFYREYISGMTRESIGRDIQADSERIKQLYFEAVESQKRQGETGELSGIQKFYRFFLSLTQRLNPTRRLIFGIACLSFIAHYFFALIGLSGYLLHPLLMPIAFGGIIAILLIELLEKTDVKRELDLARNIQLSLLPPTEFRGDSLEVYAFANTAHEVGGDYVDIIDSKKGLYVIIADVSGKGLSAALYMVRVQALVHLLIKKDEPSPKELFLELNNYIKSNKSDKTFVTACIAFFPKEEAKFILCRAGHNSPIVYSRENDATFTLKTEGLALGMASNNILSRQLREKNYHFKAGDSLLLYTDGLSEARNELGMEYGTDELETLMSIYGSLHAKSISLKIQSSLEAFIGGEKPKDDITFAVIHKAAG